MSLDSVEEQIPLLVGELESFSSQLRKQIGLLSVQAQETLPELSADLQLELHRGLTEIEDLTNALANTRCNDLSAQLIHKLALVRTYLHE